MPRLPREEIDRAVEKSERSRRIRRAAGSRRPQPWSPQRTPPIIDKAEPSFPGSPLEPRPRIGSRAKATTKQKLCATALAELPPAAAMPIPSTMARLHEHQKLPGCGGSPPPAERYRRSRDSRRGFFFFCEAREQRRTGGGEDADYRQARSARRKSVIARAIFDPQPEIVGKMAKGERGGGK